MKIRSILSLGILKILYNPKGRSTMPAAHTLTAPIWIPERLSVLFFIKMKELPQITLNKIKIAQFRAFSFDMLQM